MTDGSGKVDGQSQPIRYDFSKIIESDKFIGRHIRIETGANNEKIVNIDSAFEKAIRTGLTKISGGRIKNEYAKGTEAKAVFEHISYAPNVAPGAKATVEKIAIKEMVRANIDRKEIRSQQDSWATGQIFEKAEGKLLEKLEKDPLLKTMKEKMGISGSLHDQLKGLSEQCGADLKKGEIDSEKFVNKLAAQIRAERPGETFNFLSLETKIKENVKEFRTAQGLVAGEFISPEDCQLGKKLSDIFNATSYRSNSDVVTGLLSDAQTLTPKAFAKKLQGEESNIQAQVMLELMKDKNGMVLVEGIFTNKDDDGKLAMMAGLLNGGKGTHASASDAEKIINCVLSSEVLSSFLKERLESNFIPESLVFINDYPSFLENPGNTDQLKKFITRGDTAELNVDEALKNALKNALKEKEAAHNEQQIESATNKIKTAMDDIVVHILLSLSLNMPNFKAIKPMERPTDVNMTGLEDLGNL